jgi:hypothetical protein
MTFTGVRAFHPTPEEDPERERICDLSRFAGFGQYPLSHSSPLIIAITDITVQ